ncbi:hypothetical protein Tco_1497679, partial [Tanacetum coccineum]
KEAKVYKTYFGFAIGATPPKKVRKFKKPASPKLTTVPVSVEEPTRKSKRVKRHAKKSTKAPAKGVVIRETPERPLSKKKEKVDVTRGKGIELELLSQVALNEDLNLKNKGNDEDDSNNEQDSSGEDSDQENDSDNDRTQSDNDEDDEEEVKDELVKTPSNDSDDEDETKITDKGEGDEDEEMDYTTSQLYDDVDIRLNELVDSDKGYSCDTFDCSSYSSDLAAKFLNFSDIPHTDAEIVSPMDVHVYHEVPSQQTRTLLTVPVLVIVDSSPVFSTIIPQSFPSFTPLPQQTTPTPPPTTKATNPQSALSNFVSIFQFNNRVTTMEKEVAKLKKDPLHTQVTAFVDDHLDARLGATREEFMNFLSALLTARITEQVQNQLPQILPEEESSQPQSTYEAASLVTEFELKKIVIDKMDASQSYLTAAKHKECYDGLIKSYDLDKILFSTYDKVYSLMRSRKDKDKDEDPSAG